MTEILIWALAAVFFAVACVAIWFFLKLFFRFALVVVAVFFLFAFLYRFTLLPESISKQIEKAFFKAQEIVQEQIEKKQPNNKKERFRYAEYMPIMDEELVM